jgi:gamma-glutamyltranspeptidase/glutathione hydrolase
MQDECTTHFDAIDAQGNAVSATQSLGSGFGAAITVPGTGVTLNNFMRWFDLDADSPNAIGPGKKNEMCLSPAQVWDRDGLRLLIGTPGSYGILQTTPQMLMNVLDHGMHLQAAIEAPRVKSGRPGQEVEVETRIPAEVLAGLEARGHHLVPMGDWSPSLGGGQGIMVDPRTGSFMGGADPRRDGYALGW